MDNDPRVRSLIRRSLEAEGFTVDEAADSRRLMSLVEHRSYDLVTLDLNLRDCDGLDVARWLREHSSTPIIMVTGRGDVIDRVIGLEVGADDYIAKPFDVRELVARVRCVLRRTSDRDRRAFPPPPDTDDAFAIGSLLLVPDRSQLIDQHGTAIDLTNAELEALAALAEAGGRTLSRDALLDATHPHACESFDRAVDNLIARMRKKLPEGTIRTIRSRGYQLAVPVTRTSIAWPPILAGGDPVRHGRQ